MGITTILIALLAILGYSEWLLGTSFFQRPIILGPLAGLIMGDVQAGIIMGATLELALVGAVSIGAYNPPDMIAGTVLGVALAIQSGSGPEAALTLGIPVATIMLALNTGIGQPVMLFLIHRCDKCADRADTAGLTRNMLLAGYAQNWPGLIGVPLAFYFGSESVTRLLSNVPAFIQTGMEIASGLLPALGFAMLAQMIMNKKIAPYFFLGYFVVAYLGVPTTGVAIFAAILVAVMTLSKSQETQVQAVGAPSIEKEQKDNGGGFDEF